MKRLLLPSLAALLLLPACSSVKQELGVGRNSPDEFAAIIKSDIPKWTKVIKDAGIKIAS